MRLRTTIALALAPVVVLAACSSDGDSSTDDTATDDTSSAVTTTPVSSGGTSDVVAGEAFPPTVVPRTRPPAPSPTSPASTSRRRPRSSTSSSPMPTGTTTTCASTSRSSRASRPPTIPLVAENDAQFASGGSFSEVVAFAAANDTDFVVTAVEGPTAIDSLIVKPGVATELEDLAGSTIGVKGKLPPSVAAMLATAGLVENEDYETVLLDGFDPTAHIAIESIDGFPGYKSNEPGAARASGHRVRPVRPARLRHPGLVRRHLRQRQLHRRAPHRSRGLHARHDAWTRRCDRRSEAAANTASS